MRTMPMVWLLLSVLLLAGCNPFQMRGGTPTVAYSPQVEVEVPASVPAVDWQLAVARPTAENMLSGSRIAVREHGTELQVLAGARWSDSVPELLQGLVVRAFEDSGKILGVARQATALSADHSLAMDLRAFEVEYQDRGRPSVHVAFTAKFIGPGNRVQAARTFSARVEATGRQPTNPYRPRHLDPLAITRDNVRRNRRARDEGARAAA